MRRAGWIGGAAVLAAGLGWLVWPPDSEPRRQEPRADEAEPSQAEPSYRGRAQDGPACDHPFIPGSEGAWRRYRLTADGVGEARMTMRVLRVRRTEAELAVQWEVEVDTDAFGTMTYRGERRCTPGGDAEEPWFATTGQGMGVEIVDQSWRWPRELQKGARFGGTARVVQPGQDGQEGETAGWVHHDHAVRSRERIDVPAGTFQAWRVAVTERTDLVAGADIDADDTSRRTVWVAPGAGLVRSVLTTPQGALRHELIGLDDHWEP